MPPPTTMYVSFSREHVSSDASGAFAPPLAEAVRLPASMNGSCHVNGSRSHATLGDVPPACMCMHPMFRVASLSCHGLGGPEERTALSTWRRLARSTGRGNVARRHLLALSTRLPGTALRRMSMAPAWQESGVIASAGSSSNQSLALRRLRQGCTSTSLGYPLTRPGASHRNSPRPPSHASCSRMFALAIVRQCSPSCNTTYAQPTSSRRRQTGTRSVQQTMTRVLRQRIANIGNGSTSCRPQAQCPFDGVLLPLSLHLL